MSNCTCYDIAKTIISYFSINSSQYVFQTCSIAVITFLIPVAIMLLNTKDDEYLRDLDRRLVLTYVLKVKILSIALLFLFFPLQIQAIPVFWFMAFCYILFRLTQSYAWFISTTKRSDYRVEYLRAINNDGELQNSWAEVWQTSEHSAQSELAFFHEFSRRIESLR